MVSVEKPNSSPLFKPTSYVDGIDLNCGCPQSWAIDTGYGCAMLRDPQLIKDLTDTVRRNISSQFSVSVKIRVQHPLTTTVDLCRQLEHCGVTFISVHGRTPYQKIKDPSDAVALAEIKRSVSVPLVANGDVKTLSGADALHAQTNCDGVMSARGILSNPALFGGHDTTPLECVQHWVDLCETVGDEAITFQCYHHHLTFMMEKMMTRRVRVEFNDFTRKEQVLEFLALRYGIVPRPLANMDAAAPQPGQRVEAVFDESSFRERMRQLQLDERELERQRRRQLYSSDASEGKYFRSRKEERAGDDDDGEEEFYDNDDEDNINCSDLFGV